MKLDAHERVEGLREPCHFPWHFGAFEEELNESIFSQRGAVKDGCPLPFKRFRMTHGQAQSLSRDISVTATFLEHGIDFGERQNGLGLHIEEVTNLG